MVSINAAHDMLVEQLADGLDTPGAKRGGVGRDRAHRAAPGRKIAAEAIDWLDPAVARVLARELLGKLERGEQVDEVVLTSTGDSHEVQLALTDRRLLWLRDDAIVGRVRSLRYRDVTEVIARPPRRLRGHGELRLALVNGRRVRFFDLRPEVLRRVEAVVAGRVLR
jgi:hypothetical protein